MGCLVTENPPHTILVSSELLGKPWDVAVDAYGEINIPEGALRVVLGAAETEIRAEIARRLREEVLGKIHQYNCCGCSSYKEIAEDCIAIAEGQP